MKKKSLLLILGIVAILVVGGYTGYLYWKNASMQAEAGRVERTLAQLQETASQYKNQEVIEAITAKEALPKFEMDSVKWSEVIKEIQRTVPKSGGQQIVEILSYSGASNSDISINLKTMPGSEEPYFDVAALIRAFVDADLFSDEFVPSISAGVDEEGREILTFLLSAKYVKEQPLEVLSDLESEITEIIDTSLEQPEEGPTDQPAPIVR